MPRSTTARALLIVLALGATILLVRFLPIADLVERLRSLVETLGVLGPFLFGAAYVVASLLFVPGSALTLAAGALFGLWLGTALVSVSATATAALAFWIARHLARARVQRMAERHRTFAAVDRAIEQGGWRVVALLRLSPLVPFSAGNYLYGLTSVRFWPYLAASWVAMLPGTFLYVYLGHAGAAVAGSGGSGADAWHWVLLGVGLVATVVVTIYVTKLAKKALAERDLAGGGGA
jgi:uncharacterized membrane protein YdjX (TVP38/TMEM64 family)